MSLSVEHTIQLFFRLILCIIVGIDLVEFLIFSGKGLKRPWFLQISWQSHHINLVHHVLTFPLNKCQLIRIISYRDFFHQEFSSLVFTLHQYNKKW